MNLAAIGLVCAAVPAALFLRNLSAYRRAPQATGHPDGVSVLIPARNEEKGIGAAVASALQNEGISLEVIVLDDHSTDDTAFIVEAIASVRFESASGAG